MSHDNNSDGYERITRFHVEQYAYLTTKPDSMGIYLERFGDADTRLERI